MIFWHLVSRCSLFYSFLIWDLGMKDNCPACWKRMGMRGGVLGLEEEAGKDRGNGDVMSIGKMYCVRTRWCHGRWTMDAVSGFSAVDKLQLRVGVEGLWYQ